MSQWTKKRNIQLIPPGRWTQQYQHQPQHQHFDKLMDPISIKELNETIETIPNNKSLGPSKIPNEI